MEIDSKDPGQVPQGNREPLKKTVGHHKGHGLGLVVGRDVRSSHTPRGMCTWPLLALAAPLAVLGESKPGVRASGSKEACGIVQSD